jgi:uncharacterized protein
MQCLDQTGQLQLPKLQEAFKNLRLIKAIREKSSENYNSIDKDLLSAGYITDKNLISKKLKSRNKLLSAYAAYPEVDSLKCELDISMIGYQVYNECVYENDRQNPENFGDINDRDLGMCFSLITRINTLTKNSNFTNIFGINEKSTDSANFYNIYQKFISIDNKDKNILVIAVDKIPTEHNLKTIVINAFGRFLLEEALDKKFKQKPILVFLDEAHLFLNQNIKDEYSIEVQLNSFERIAKECRKFGLFLTLATQMPRDIPVGILSQFGTFIVHRLINQRDRETIEFACSEATKSSLAFLPTLIPGQALITGVDFPMPIILQIEKPLIEPDSRTPQIFETIKIGDSDPC